MRTYLIATRAPAGFRPPQEAFAGLTAWFERLGEHVADCANPAFGAAAVGNTRRDTVLAGYTLVTAESLEAAVVLAEQHPLVTGGGGVEVVELTAVEVGNVAEPNERPGSAPASVTGGAPKSSPAPARAGDLDRGLAHPLEFWRPGDPVDDQQT